MPICYLTSSTQRRDVMLTGNSMPWQVLLLRWVKAIERQTPVYHEVEPPVTIPVAEEVKSAPVVEQPKKKKQLSGKLLKQNIFFALNSARIQDDQQAKIASLIEYMKKYPTATMNVTGYADVNTGNPGINRRLSETRANNVAEALKAKGITNDRIIVDFKGDTVQPYSTPEENRVSICIAE